MWKLDCSPWGIRVKALGPPSNPSLPLPTGLHTLASLLFPHHMKLTVLFSPTPGRLFPQPLSGIAPIAPFAFPLNRHLREAFANCPSSLLYPPTHYHPCHSDSTYPTLFLFTALSTTCKYIIYLLVVCLFYWNVNSTRAKTLFCPLIYPSCLHECHAQSRCARNICWMDERMGGWKEIWKHKQIKAYTYKGSQAESCVQRMVCHGRNACFSKTWGQNVSWAESLPTRDLGYRNEAHSDNERKKKSLLQC